LEDGANTKYHAVHAFVFLGYPLTTLGAVFCKSPQTISNWVKKWLLYKNIYGYWDVSSHPNLLGGFGIQEMI
jgi:hypothetical protein